MIKPDFMRALWIENQQLSMRTDIVPGHQNDGVEVDVTLAGICGTDLELLRGYYDFVGVPGHEFVGEIASGARKGERVVADINFGCGKCEQCRLLGSHHCSERQVLGIKSATGAFAEKINVPQQNLVSVPDHVPNWQAAQVEPLAAAMQILEQITVDQRRVLLVGAGRLGRMVIRVIQALSPSTDLQVCVRDTRRAAEQITADFVAPNQVEAGRYDVTVDCTGHPDGFASALKAVKPRGTVVVKSTYADVLTLNMSRIVVDEISVQGSRCGNIQAAMDCLAQGRISLPEQRLVYLPIEAFASAFDQASEAGTEKVFFQFRQDSTGS